MTTPTQQDEDTPAQGGEDEALEDTPEPVGTFAIARTREGADLVNTLQVGRRFTFSL